MKKILLSCLALVIISYTVSADFATSGNYSVFMATDEAGGQINSTNFVAYVTASEISGFSSSLRHNVCFGYMCVEFGPLGEILKITFILQTDATDKNVYVDTNTDEGTYSPGDISKFFVCAEDTANGQAPVVGISFAGSALNYIRLDKTNLLTMRMSQNAEDNKFIVPVTVGGCTVVSNKMPLSLPYTPFVPFNDLMNAVELMASYPVDLVGSFERTGRFTLTLEKTGNNVIAGETP
jgi:hypothetical protein